MESIHAGLQMMLDRGELLKAQRQFRRGDFSVRMPLNLTGIDGEIAQAFNDVVELEESKAAELARLAELVGKEGQFGHRMSLAGASGGWAEVTGAGFAGVWKDLTDNVNQLGADLTRQVRNVAEVSTAVAKGDLSRKITVDAKGEVLELKSTINTLVDQLNAFAAEVTRVAKE